MNNITLDEFRSREEYMEFKNNNSGRGMLSIKATSAEEAVPINDLRVIVTYRTEEYDVVFFEGKTDSSGNISNIQLPAPKRGNDLDRPHYCRYLVTGAYRWFQYKYDVLIYDGISAVQKINVVPGEAS